MSIRTFIDFCADNEDQGGLKIILDAMAGLGAACCVDTYAQPIPCYVYSIYQSPHYVLNGLEKLAGYKVDASNSITDSGTSCTPVSHYQIWTLHKQTQSSAN